MKGLPCLLIAVLSLLSIASPVLADPVKTATIDLLLQREGVGAVVVDDDRGLIYFERIAPAWSPDNGFTFAVSPSSQRMTIKKIYVAPMDGSEKARPLFNQADEDSYAFARSVMGPLDIVSSDGRYLTVHHLKDGVERLGVYDLSERSFRYVDAEMGDRAVLTDPLWVGEDELIVTSNDGYVLWALFWDVIKAARNIAAAREAAWKSDEVSVEVTGSGKYAKRTGEIKHQPVTQINVSTGTTNMVPREEIDIYKDRLFQLRLVGAENARKRLKPNPAALNPPNCQSLLLASSERGEVFLTHDKEVGSLLEFVPKEHNAARVLLFEYNTHLIGVKTAVGPIQIDHKDYAGEDVKSWLFLPPGASLDRPEPYPLVVIPYPGPIYDVPPGNDSLLTYDIWALDLGIGPVAMEVFAAQGYAVLLPSIPYANNAERAVEIMPSIMVAIDSALDSAIETGFVDSDRMALTGHSFGGYTALSVAVQSDRFQAIISAMMISNIISADGTFNILRKINSDRFEEPAVNNKYAQFRLKASLWEAPDLYVRNSPLFFVGDVSTPILLIHADLDTATPVAQAEEVFTALNSANKDAQFVKYFGEHHRIEQPKHQRDMWRRVFGFLEDNGATPAPRTIQ